MTDNRTRVLDRARLEDFLQVLDDADVVDLLASFLSAAPVHLERIHALRDQGDFSGLAKEVHKLKGVSVNLAAVRVASTALSIEEAIERGASEEAAALCDRLRRDIDETESAIRRFIGAPAGRRIDTLVAE